MRLLKNTSTLAVNLAPLSPLYYEVKPKYHVLADAGFFAPGNESVDKLWTMLAQVDWSMTLFVPARCAKRVPAAVRASKFVKVQPFNNVGVEGFSWFTRLAFSRGWGMPRPRNVLVPSIMNAIWLGYKEIYVAGADHSWMQTIAVDGDNRVISVQPHFYKDDDKEQKRVDTLYAGYRLHDIVYSFYVAFKSYHDIEAFARYKGVDVYNCTPGSFIDAFRRRDPE